MPREQREIAPEPRYPERQLRPSVLPEARWPKGALKPSPVTVVKTPLRFKTAKCDDPYKVENRWYFAGAVCIGYVQVFKAGTQRAGDLCLHITSREGNSGVWFTDDKGLHKFIEDELQREPF